MTEVHKITDGTFNFEILRGDESPPTQHSVDLLLLKMTCEACEVKHELKVKDGMFVPTPEFIVDLAGRISTLGVDNCSPTIAMKLWVTAAARVGELKKSIDEPQS